MLGTTNWNGICFLLFVVFLPYKSGGVSGFLLPSCKTRHHVHVTEVGLFVDNHQKVQQFQLDNFYSRRSFKILSQRQQAVAARQSSSSSLLYLYGEGGDGNDNDDDKSKKHQDILWDAILKKFSENNTNMINSMEIRLDATLASCYGLCRFLIFDVSTGAKDMPGWQLTDFIMLGGAFSSCIVLSLLWSVVGIWTGIFNYDDDTNTTTSNSRTSPADQDANQNENEIIWNVASTAAIVGPLWLFMEIIFGWPPGGVMIHPNELDFASNNDTYLYYIYTIVTGTVGLASIMCLNKVLTSGQEYR